MSEAISLCESGDRITSFLADARRYFSPQELVLLTLSVMAVNDWIDLKGKSLVQILVVDDNPHDHMLLNRQLRKVAMGDHILFLSDPRIALDLFQGAKAERFRENLVAIFLDVHMPYLTGIDLLRLMRSFPAWKDFPVIVMTADSNPRIVAECAELKVRAFVDKPITAEVFTRFIAPLLRHRTT